MKGENLLLQLLHPPCPTRRCPGLPAPLSLSETMMPTDLCSLRRPWRDRADSPRLEFAYANRPPRHHSQGDPRPDGGGHGQAVPAAVQAARGRPCDVGDDYQRPALLEY